MSGETLIYGDGGQGALVFLEEGYVAELRDFCNALESALTWGEPKEIVNEERYMEAVERWKDEETDSPPKLEDDFETTSLRGYEDGDFPEFAPKAMDRWVDGEIVREYGGYEATMTGYTASVDFDNEETVVKLLEERGYECVRDDDQIWARRRRNGRPSTGHQRRTETLAPASRQGTGAGVSPQHLPR